MQRKKQELAPKQRNGTKLQASQTSSDQNNRSNSISSIEDMYPFVITPTKRLKESVDESKLTDLFSQFERKIKPRGRAGQELSVFLDTQAKKAVKLREALKADEVIKAKAQTKEQKKERTRLKNKLSAIEHRVRDRVIRDAQPILHEDQNEYMTCFMEAVSEFLTPEICKKVLDQVESLKVLKPPQHLNLNGTIKEIAETSLAKKAKKSVLTERNFD